MKITNRISRRNLLFWGLRVGFAASAAAVFSAAWLSDSPAIADAKLTGTNPAHWRVIWTSDPATEAIVSWSTKDAGKTHKVFFRAAGEKVNQEISAQRNARFSDGDFFYHHAMLRKLRPGTKYFVQMESDGVKSPKFYFKTAPADDVTISMLAGGDSRSRQNVRRAMNKLMAGLLEKHPDILALAHGGDYIKDGEKMDLWSMWLSDHELTTAKDGRMLPIIPARGNHEDEGPQYNEVFGFPKVHKGYYAMNLSSQVRLVTLNTEADYKRQTGWLEKELRAAAGKYRWILAQYHRPAWPAVKKPSDAKKYWVPLFEKYNVAMAFEADGHALKRTVPIRGNKMDPTGVVYVGEGGLGVSNRSPKKKNEWYLKPPGLATKGDHVQMVTLSAEKLDFKVIMRDGSIRDAYSRKPILRTAGAVGK